LHNALNGSLVESQTNVYQLELVEHSQFNQHHLVNGLPCLSNTLSLQIVAILLGGVTDIGLPDSTDGLFHTYAIFN